MIDVIENLKEDVPVIDYIEQTLRPAYLTEFRGQPKAVKLLQIAVAGANQRNEAPDHTLIYGPPGLGKTTLASIVAREIGGGFKVVMAPSISKAGDLASILVGLSERDILFLDEIHRLPAAAAEILYGVMEDFKLDIVAGDGNRTQAISLTIPKFCLIGATTRPGMLSPPFRDRFSLNVNLSPYNDVDMEAIITRSARILGMILEEGVSMNIARRSRGTPRIGNTYLRRLRDYAAFEQTELIDMSMAELAFEVLGVDKDGLNEADKRYLNLLKNRFRGKPVGLKTIAAALGEDSDTIEHELEPWLLQKGYVERTSRGRMLAEDLADKIQQELF